MTRPPYREAMRAWSVSMVPETAPLDAGDLSFEQPFPKTTSAAIRSAKAVLTAREAKEGSGESQAAVSLLASYCGLQ